MKNRRNYYRILQVQFDAPPEIIRASYRTIMRELRQHPDLGGDQWNAYVINEAYETLSDSVKRAEYDRNFFRDHSAHISPEKKRPASKGLKSTSNENAYHDSNQRSIHRVIMNGAELCYFTHPQYIQEARMIDLSTKGIRFVCSEKLPDGSTVTIRCPLFRAEARVINSKINLFMDKPIYVTGAQFLSVNFKNPRGSFCSRVV